MNRHGVRHLGLTLILALTAGCATPPPTHETRIAFPDAPLRELAAALHDAELAARRPLPDTSALAVRAHRVGRQVVAANPVSIPAQDWTFTVFEANDMHAFALPGGRIGINAGLIASAAGEADIAVVIAREIAGLELHLPHKRMVEALSRLAVNAPDAIADEAARNRKALRIATGLSRDPDLRLPFSRTDTWAVDDAGLLLAARAGYDPRAVLAFWSRLETIAEATGEPPTYLKVHPGYNRRAHRLRRAMPEALAIYEQARTAAEPSNAP